MFFKQMQIFQLLDPMGSITEISESLEVLRYKEGLASLPINVGWISPCDDEDDAPLVKTMNGYMMICLQVEEKILPPSVIRQELANRVKEIESTENRKVGQKEKFRLKEDLTAMLIPRAFSKQNKIYAYVDAKNAWVILNTTNSKKMELFLSFFRKSFGDNIKSLPIEKLSSIMTSWLVNQNYSSSFSIEKSCVMQDVQHQTRVIRCREQNLFADAIQSLIKDGCEIKQLALNWQDRVDFMLMENLTLQSIRFKDEVIALSKEMEPETKQQQFHADFLIMTGTFDGLIKDLLDSFLPQSSNKSTLSSNKTAKDNKLVKALPTSVEV